MKKIITLLLLTVLFSCTDAGTFEKVDKGNNPNIEVFKYYYENDNYVYVSYLKDKPNIINTQWTESNGKTSHTYSNTSYSEYDETDKVFENDTITFIYK